MSGWIVLGTSKRRAAYVAVKDDGKRTRSHVT
jgi:hypothetical protein